MADHGLIGVDYVPAGNVDFGVKEAPPRMLTAEEAFGTEKESASAEGYNLDWENWLEKNPEGLTPVKEENSGGNVNYYRVAVVRPNQSKTAYTAECSDIIEALGMDFNEGEAFATIWRRAAQRTLGLVKAGNTAKRDAEKVAHFGRRMLAQYEPPIADSENGVVTTEVRIGAAVAAKAMTEDDARRLIKFIAMSFPNLPRQT